MNWYFYKIWIPLQVATLVSFLAIILGYVDLNFWIIFVSWFLIGPVGIGVGFHRLFSHRQFQTWKPVEYTLAILGTLTAYAPVSFWPAAHSYHHEHNEEPGDPSSPTQYGFWESFLWWRLREGTIKKVNLRNYCMRVLFRDEFLMYISKHFVKIIYIYAALLLLAGPFWFVNLFIVPAFIEHIRINLLSSACHMKLPFSYKNFETKDDAHNNIFLGYLTFGFGWHNNHHYNERELVNSHRWWELDVEGLIGKLLSKKS